MKDALIRLLALCALSAATRRMKLAGAIGHICSLCVIEALVEIIARAFEALYKGG